MFRIKICGITNIHDAEIAVESGADAIGFVFAKSVRRTGVETARRIIRKLPSSVVSVGVFVNEDRDCLRDIAEYCGLSAIQFHGEEPPDYCGCFRDYMTLKAVRIRKGFDPGEIRRYRVDGFIFDSYNPLKQGGTGEVFDWGLISSLEFDLPVILAGGLNSENLERAIGVSRAYGVDVSSGVEREPGVKDERKLREFVEKARRLLGADLAVDRRIESSYEDGGVMFNE